MKKQIEINKKHLSEFYQKERKQKEMIKEEINQLIKRKEVAT